VRTAMDLADVIPWLHTCRNCSLVMRVATTVTRMDNTQEQVIKLRRELSQQNAQLRELQLLMLRVSGVAAIVLMVIGLVLPAWSEEIDDKHLTARVLTVGFVALWGQDEQVSAVPGIGFIGLVVVVLLLCGLLVNAVAAGGGREGAGLRGTIATLAVLGSVIASLFSYVGWVSDESDVSGGLGPVVLLAGVLVGVAVLRYRPWRELSN
jgi:hypothetical protein